MSTNTAPPDDPAGGAVTDSSTVGGQPDHSGGPLTFPFQQVATAIEQPGLDEFLNRAPVDDPDRDVIGPETDAEDQYLEFEFCQVGSRIRINSVYSGTVSEIFDASDYRRQDTALFTDLGVSTRNTKVYVIDLEDQDVDTLHVKVTCGYSSHVREVEYLHGDLKEPVAVSQVSVSNTGLPADVDKELFQTLAGLSGSKVFHKDSRGSYQIVTVQKARFGHVQITIEKPYNSTTEWCFIAEDTTTTSGIENGHLTSARTTDSAAWGLTPSVSGDPGEITVLDIGYTSTGLEFPSEVHDDGGALSDVFPDLHRIDTDQTETLVETLGGLTGGSGPLDPSDPIDAVTGVGTTTAHELSGLPQPASRPSKTSLKNRLEAAETVEITEGDPEVKAKLEALQEARDDQESEDDSDGDDGPFLISIDAILDDGPELYEISRQYRDQATSDIRNAIDGADRFDTNVAFRLFTAMTNGLMFSPNGVKTGSLVQMHMGNVDEDGTAFAGAPAGDGDAIDFSQQGTILGQTPAVFLSHEPLTNAASLLRKAWKDSPTTSLANLTAPAYTIVETLTTTTENESPTTPERFPVETVEPHLVQDKLGLHIETPEDRADWVSIPTAVAEFVAGMLGVNILEDRPEDIHLSVYKSGAVELKHPNMDLWLTVTP